jgi:hypothetical protein
VVSIILMWVMVTGADVGTGVVSLGDGVDVGPGSGVGVAVGVLVGTVACVGIALAGEAGAAAGAGAQDASAEATSVMGIQGIGRILSMGAFIRRSPEQRLSCPARDYRRPS